MSTRSRFFDSSEGDRVYTSDAWAQVLSSLQSTGVVPGIADELLVHESSPAAMSVRVKLGTAFILGYYFEIYSAEEEVSIGAADGSNPRIDRIVARRSLANREVTIAVLTGTPAASPSAPALTQNTAGTYEIPLAQVLIPALASAVEDTDINDERGTRSLGYDLAAALHLTTGHDHDGSDSKAVAYSSISGTPSTFAPSTHAHTGGSSGGTIAYSALTSIPSTFAPSSHTHADGSTGGTISYTVLTSKPSTFAPSAHATAHQAGGGDPLTAVAWGILTGVPSTFTPASHNIDSGHSGSLPWSRLSSVPSTFAPSSHSLASHTGDADSISAWAQGSAGGGAAGIKIWVGTTTPSSGVTEGDIWAKG